MFTNIKNRLISVIAPDIAALPSPTDGHGGGGGMVLSSQQLRLAQQQMHDKFAYARPPFLQLLTQDELRASADHNVRPIIVPRDGRLLPWGTGYAECVNSGKSEWNEDQGAFCRQVLSDPSHRHPDLPYTYFGVFDGHAGYGAALAASHQFHHILHEKLVDCIELLLPRDGHSPPANTINGFPHPSQFQRRITKDELIMGALESAFQHMDALIAQDRDRYRDAGGCTACVALFINGKMFVSNAGDSRAVLCQRRTPVAVSAAAGEQSGKKAPIDLEQPDPLGSFATPFSFDHTPETERPRLLNVARLKPHLMGKYYVATEYAKRPHQSDLGQRILCRTGTMRGWTYKTLTREDLLMPVVLGEGKRSRLLGTLGVTRGFGDHDLLAIHTDIQIKPFLTPQPDVTCRDLSTVVSIPDEHNEDGDYGILVMATDGLWDVSENETVARTVFQTLAKYATEKHRYTMVAQELVARARGKINDSGHWRLADTRAAATVDDISVIVIPVYQYYKEHVEWEKKCLREHNERLQLQTSQATEAKEEDETVLFNGLNSPPPKGDKRASRRDDNAVDEDDESEEEEEITVELNEQTVHAQVEIESSEIDPNTEEVGDSSSTLAVVAEKTSSGDISEQVQAAVSSLEAARISEPESDVSSPGSQDQANKSKQQQQQQRNRNRRDKR